MRVWVSRAQDAFTSASFANSANANAPPPPSLLFVAADLGVMMEAEDLEAVAQDHDDKDGVVAVEEKAKASAVVVVVIVILVVVIVVVIVAVVVVVPPARSRTAASSISIFDSDCGINSGGWLTGKEEWEEERCLSSSSQADCRFIFIFWRERTCRLPLWVGCGCHSFAVGQMGHSKILL